MQESIGQNQSIWAEEWKKLSVESEIHMWDYFGLRPWIMKYVPRFGKVTEAGCGLGRYVFLLEKFGIEIEGLDFSEETIQLLNTWKTVNGIESQFKVGDVTKLPYEDNSLSGYLSFGVIEHFIEGPQKPLAEAFRVLRPGGVAIITTPSKSWFYYYNRLRYRTKNIIKRIIGKKVNKPPFFQYWYSPKQLKKFIENAGLKVTRNSGADILYTFNEFCRLYKIKTENHKWLFNLANKLENTFLKQWGAQSVVIAIKPSEKMHCFFCGELAANCQSLKIYDVPVCDKHNADLNRIHYKKSCKNPKFNFPYQIQPMILQPQKQQCAITNQFFMTDKILECYGLSIPVHPDLLKKPEQNIELSINYLSPIWRNRS